MKRIITLIATLMAFTSLYSQDYTIVSMGDNKYAIDINRLDSVLFVKEEASIPRISHDTIYQDRILWVHDTIYVDGNVKTFKAGPSPSPQIASLDGTGRKSKTAESRNGKDLSIVTIGQDSYVIDTELLEDNDIVPIKRYNEKEYRDTTYKSRNVWVHDTVYIDLKNSYSINGVYYPIPEAVDLGLPSGTLWASCNLGASDHIERGGYFAWGETAPKNEYSYLNYAFSIPSQAEAFKEFVIHGIENIQAIEDKKGNQYLKNQFYSKYYIYRRAPEPSPVYTDSLTELQDEDNAVKTLLGGEWDIPTVEQTFELANNTTQELIELEEVEIDRYGRKVHRALVKFTGGNGNSIYLRLAGFMWASFDGVGKGFLVEEEEGGHYWTKDISLEMKLWDLDPRWGRVGGYFVEFWGTSCGLCFWKMSPERFGERPSGRTIRPVKNMK